MCDFLAKGAMQKTDQLGSSCHGRRARRISRSGDASPYANYGARAVGLAEQRSEFRRLSSKLISQGVIGISPSKLTELQPAANCPTYSELLVRRKVLSFEGAFLIAKLSNATRFLVRITWRRKCGPASAKRTAGTYGCCLIGMVEVFDALGQPLANLLEHQLRILLRQLGKVWLSMFMPRTQRSFGSITAPARIISSRGSEWGDRLANGDDSLAAAFVPLQVLFS